MIIRKKLACTILAVALESYALADYSTVILDDSPVAYYRLDEASGTTGANQGSLGSSADGTYVGSVTTDQTGLLDSDTNKAASFQGGHVDVPSVSGINQGGPFAQKTIELWFKADSVSGRQVLYEQGNHNRGLNIYLDYDTLYVAGYNRVGNPSTRWGTPNPIYVSSATTIQAGVVYYVVLVLDGNSSETGTLEGYLNGVSFGQSGGAGELYDDAAAVIGAVDNKTRFHDQQTVNSGSGFSGVIDEVAHYNAALTTTQILSHYEAGTASGPTVSGVRIIKWVEAN